MVAGSRKVRGTHQGVLQRSNLKMDFARSVLYRRSIKNRAGRASFFALNNCGNVRWECRFKATFPPNISIEKFCQSAKRIIGVSSAAVVRDVFATTASFKRCTVLHNAFPVCTTVYVFQANSTRTLALAPSRPLQNTSTHHAVSSWLLDPGRYAVHTKAYYNGRI